MGLEKPKPDTPPGPSLNDQYLARQIMNMDVRQEILTAAKRNEPLQLQYKDPLKYIGIEEFTLSASDVRANARSLRDSYDSQSLGFIKISREADGKKWTINELFVFGTFSAEAKILEAKRVQEEYRRDTVEQARRIIDMDTQSVMSYTLVPGTDQYGHVMRLFLGADFYSYLHEVKLVSPQNYNELVDHLIQRFHENRRVTYRFYDRLAAKFAALESRLNEPRFNPLRILGPKPNPFEH